MRILALPKYTRRGASSRQRFHQFVPRLREAGLDVDVAPLWLDAHIDRLYGGRRPDPIAEVRAFAARVRTVLRARADVVWLEGEALPYLPAVLEPLLAARARLVVDYDDAQFHKYDLHPRGLVRAALGDKFARIVRRAHVVVVGNDYLRQFAQQAGAVDVRRIPTVVDLARYPAAPPPAHARVVVGWIGSPHTEGYLEIVAPILGRLVDEGRIDVCLIGATRPPRGLRAEVVAWSEDSEAAQLASIDIGIMPLPDAPWERGKCGYKIVQYFAAGRPVVASPVGANVELVDADVGFLAANEDDWRRALLALLDPEVRRRLGAAARARAESYNVDAVLPRLLDALAGRSESRCGPPSARTRRDR